MREYIAMDTGTAIPEAVKSFRHLKVRKELTALRAASLRHQGELLGEQPIASKNLAASDSPTAPANQSQQEPDHRAANHRS